MYYMRSMLTLILNRQRPMRDESRSEIDTVMSSSRDWARRLRRVEIDMTELELDVVLLTCSERLTPASRFGGPSVHDNFLLWKVTIVAFE